MLSQCYQDLCQIQKKNICHLHVKQLLKYVESSRDYSLIYPKNNSIVLTGFTNSDHAGDLGDRISTSGFIFILSGCSISWKSVKQKTVAISSTEAEYISLSEATQQALWISQLLKELGFPQNKMLFKLLIYVRLRCP